MNGWEDDYLEWWAGQTYVSLNGGLSKHANPLKSTYTTQLSEDPSCGIEIYCLLSYLLHRCIVLAIRRQKPWPF